MSAGEGPQCGAVKALLYLPELLRREICGEFPGRVQLLQRNAGKCHPELLQPRQVEFRVGGVGVAVAAGVFEEFAGHAAEHNPFEPGRLRRAERRVDEVADADDRFGRELRTVPRDRLRRPVAGDQRGGFSPRRRGRAPPPGPPPAAKLYSIEI